MNWKAEPKIGSLDNTHHTPGGGDKKVGTAGRLKVRTVSVINVDWLAGWSLLTWAG